MSRSKRSPSRKGEPCELPRVGKPFVPDLVWPRGDVPEILLSDPKLSAGARLCYILMARLGRLSGRCYASEATLAAGLARHWRQVKRYLEELRARHYIRAKARPGLSTVWLLLWHRRFRSFASQSLVKSGRGMLSRTTTHPCQVRQPTPVRDGSRTLRSKPGKVTRTDDDGVRAPGATAAGTADLEAAIRECQGRPDPQAAAQIAAGCRLQLPDVTDGELAYCVRRWLPELSRQRSVHNPLGLLIARMPSWIAPAVLEYRERQETEQRQAEEARASVRRLWQGVLDDPHSSQDDRRMARRELAGAGGG